MSWTLHCETSDDEHVEHVMHTFEDIENVVQRAVDHARATHGRPTLVELSLDDQSAMGIVVGGERSYAMFMYTPNGPVYYSLNRAASEAEDGEPLIYNQFGSQSEADYDTTISPAEAWEALRLYFETGKRPQTIDWGPTRARL
jgi:hypothetical protein